MSTVVELRQMAKDQHISGYSKMKKAELQEALGLEVSAPRVVKPKAKPTVAESAAAAGASSSSASAPKASPKPARVIPQNILPDANGPVVELFELVEVHEDGVAITSLIPLSEIDDLDKLMEQIKLNTGDREREEDAQQDYVEKIIAKRSRRIVGSEGSEISVVEHIKYTQVALMY